MDFFDYRIHNIDKYVIYVDTLAIIPVNKFYSFVIERYQTFFVNMNVRQLLEYNCNLRGTSLLGAQDAARNLLNIRALPPILIDAKNDIFLFPLTHMKNRNNIWINPNTFTGYDNGLIVFENNYMLETTFPEHKFITQYNLVRKYRLLLRKVRLNIKETDLTKSPTITFFPDEIEDENA